MFVRHRDAAAPVLLFVHGLGESGLCFERIVEHPALSELACLVPDLPGYGRSAWRGEPQTLQEAADHLATWVRARGGAPVVVVGHSMGGVVALLLAETAPELVSALVNVDGNLSSADCAYSGLAAKQSLDHFVGAGFDGFREGLYGSGVDDAAIRGYYVSLRLADPRTFHRHSVELVALSGPERLAARLAALPLPTLYIAGVPRGAGARSLELLAAAGVATRRVGPAGHWPFIDQPDSFAAELRAFVDGLPPTPR